MDMSLPKENLDPGANFWSEKVYVLTNDYKIYGYIFMPKTIKKNRVISDILNGDKRFIAIKNVTIIPRNNPEFKEEHNFIQINLDKIEIVRPFKEAHDNEYLK